MAFNLQLVAKTMGTRTLLHLQASRFQQGFSRSLHSVVQNGSSSSQQTTSINNNHQLLTRKTLEAQQTRTLVKLWKERTLRAMYWRGRRFDRVPERKAVPRSEYQDWKYSAEVAAFAARLGEPQLTEADLTRAFTHRSFVSAQQAKQTALGIADVQLQLEDNSELIAEGRELMANYVRPYLRYHLRSAPEECIESVTQYLLSEGVLAEVAKWIGCIGKSNC